MLKKEEAEAFLLEVENAGDIHASLKEVIQKAYDLGFKRGRIYD